jgi:TonB-linked SusC/RagA family outer membrane protein
MLENPCIIIRRIAVIIMICVISGFQVVRAQTPEQDKREIRGIVTDNTGAAMPGVTVVVKGTLTGIITGLNGEYVITVRPNYQKLVFTSIGMKTVERDILGQSQIDVVMTEDIIGLDEIVVTGYMTQKKADLTGSIAVIDKKDLENISTSNVLVSMQGKIPGVYITTDGNPAENMSIEIRGRTSSTSTSPLIVIDGLPTTANLREINALDIESMQVLKDAASASIYGSRAASGVILITTKQGRPGDFSVTYDGSVGMNTYIRIPDLMNTEQYGRTIWQAAVNDGLDPNQQTQLYDFDWGYEGVNPKLNGMTTVEWLNSAQTLKASDTDWFDALTQNGIRQNHQLSISSATEKARQLFSVNYFENNGAQIHTYLKRISGRINTSYDLLDGRLKIGENLGLTSTVYNDQNGIYRALVMPPIAPEYAIDGVSWGGSAMESGMDEHRHPTKDQILNKDNSSKRMKLIGSVFADLSLFKGFSLRTQYGIEYSTRDYRNIDFTWQEVGGQADALNSVSSYYSKSMIWTWTNTAQYSYSSDIHNIDVLAGMESFRDYGESFSATRELLELENYDYAYLNAATGNLTASGSGSEVTMVSYFGKLNYSLLNKYLVGITARFDGCSKFSNKNKFGFFPSASLGWRISGEDFMSGLDVISDLKLRVSWGMNGNSNISTNAVYDYYSANYASTSYMIDGGKEGLMPSGYYLTHRGNPDIFWEASEQTNLGLDFGILDNRLYGTLDLYHKITEGMLYEPSYIGTIGEGGATWINAADMTNKGIELGLTLTSKPNSKLYYSITGNFASNSNKIDNLPDAVVYSYGGNGLGDNILGRPFRSFYGFVFDGLYQTQQEVDEGPEQNGKRIGGMKFKDLDGDGRITEEYDRTWIGVREPVLTYGLNTYLEYKGIDLNFFLQGVIGNDVNNDYKLLSDFYNTGVIAGRNHSTRLLTAWTPYNTSSTIPALSITNVNEEIRLSTYFIEKGSYLKLRNIELGYTLPGLTSQKFYVKKLRVYASAENTLLICKRKGDNAFTGVDPESGSDFTNAYDRPSVFTFGISATF